MPFHCSKGRSGDQLSLMVAPSSSRAPSNVRQSANSPGLPSATGQVPEMTVGVGVGVDVGVGVSTCCAPTGVVLFRVMNSKHITAAATAIPVAALEPNVPAMISRIRFSPAVGV